MKMENVVLGKAAGIYMPTSDRGANLLPVQAWNGSAVRHDAVLLGDLLEDASQARNGSQHGAKHLCLQDGQCGDRGQSIDGGHVDDLAVHEAALDLELTVELLGKVSDHARGGDGIGSDGKRRGTVQLIIELIEADVVESKAEQGVLDNCILDIVLTALSAELGVFRDGDALVVNDNAGSCALQLLGQRGHDRLLFRQNFCVRHFLSSPPLDFAARLACQGKEAF